VPTEKVEWREEKPYHPEDPTVELEPQQDKMSKSRGNVVNPDAIVSEYGADALRCYEMFMGPLEQVKPWDTRSVVGVSRFLSRVWSLLIGDNGELRPQIVAEAPDPHASLTRRYHKTVKKVTEDLEGMRFNTAVSALMELVNEAHKVERLPRAVVEGLVLLLSPFAPHLGEELWERLGHTKTLAYESWPTSDPALVRDEMITVPVQVNGKLRTTIEVAADADQAAILMLARAQEKVQSYLSGKTIRREVVVPGRLVNFVVS
jgi:leucyl-tRNA synthetase